MSPMRVTLKAGVIHANARFHKESGKLIFWKIKHRKMFYDELISTYLKNPSKRFFTEYTVDESRQIQKIMTNGLPARFNLSCHRSSVFEGADITSGKTPWDYFILRFNWSKYNRYYAFIEFSCSIYTNDI